MEMWEILLEEIGEIEELITKWRDSTDVEVNWAISLLEYTLARRRLQLRRVLMGERESVCSN